MSAENLRELEKNAANIISSLGPNQRTALQNYFEALRDESSHKCSTASEERSVRINQGKYSLMSNLIETLFKKA